jgi:predicted O-linked N-acetylglucosamine transferase (SPINDLY family)
MDQASALLEQALTVHRHGEIDKAAQLYRQILDRDPEHSGALYGVAVIACQQDRLGEGVALVRRALAGDPRHARAHNLLGTGLTRLGRAGDALASFDQAIALQPQFAEAHGNRGNALSELGRTAEAIESHDRALALRPDSLPDWCNRGNALAALGRDADAIASYDRALALDPALLDVQLARANLLARVGRNDQALAGFHAALEIAPNHVGALVGLGDAVRAAGRPDEALQHYDRALAIEPGNVSALNNRGVTLHELKRYQEALTCYDRALSAMPHSADVLINRGNACQQLQFANEALSCYDRALALRPDDVNAVSNRGLALSALKRYDEALACFDKALALRPGNAAVLNYRGITQLLDSRIDDAIESFRLALKVDPDIPYALGHLVYASMQACDWSELDQDIAAVRAAVRAGKHAIEPLELQAASDSSAELLQCARTFVSYVEPVGVQPLWRGERYRHDRIRIGYVTADFRVHPVAFLITGLIERHDRSRFEVYSISLSPDRPDATRDRIRRGSDRFITVDGKNEHEIAALMRGLEIDVAVDLMGHTSDARPNMFSHRPAPIQVNYLGYPGTTGMQTIDYIVADRIVIPEDQREHYSERVVYLPDCYQANDGAREDGVPTPTRTEAGLPSHGFVFCAFNNSFKITPDVFDAWMRLLGAVEGSVLWLLASNPSAQRNLGRAAQRRGIAPQRLIFAPRLAVEAHRARQRLADLFLDTLPYNAHTTGSDALWAGVPVVTRLGSAFAGRVGASLLHAVGLPELVTHSVENYEALALHLARDPAALAALKQKLVRQRDRHPLFDTDLFCRRIEAAYVTMWEIWQRGEAPRGFEVPAADARTPPP